MFRVFAAILVLGFAHLDEHRMARAPQSAPRKADRKRGASPAKRPLGDDIARVIKDAKRISIYHLAAFAAAPGEERPAGKKFFADHEVLDFDEVDKERVSKLKKILLDEKNYVKSGESNKCTFTATVGLEIVSKKGAVTTLVSYRCDKVLFIHNGQELYRDVKSLRHFDEIAHGILKGQLG
jgi:hypothetical protein